MICQKCEKNYLYNIFNYCMDTYEPVSFALMQFDKICIESGDPRNPLTIIKSMYDNSCDDCDMFKSYYINIIARLGI